MYLPQAISSPSSIGTEPDHFLCIDLAQESPLEPAHITFGMMVRPLRATLHNLAPVRCGATRSFLGRIGQEYPDYVSQLGPVLRFHCVLR